MGQTLKPKKLYLLVTPFFPSPEDWRGSYCFDFVRAMQREGSFDVRVFVPGKGDAYDYCGVRVRTFKTLKLPSEVFPFMFARFNASSFLQAMELEGIDVSSVAVCHGHTATFSIYPLAVKDVNPKCLTLLHHHDLQSFGLNSGILRHCWLYNMIEFPILRRYHEKLDAHVFISEMVKKSFLSAPDTSWTKYSNYRKQMRGLPYRHVRVKNSIVVHNGVDTQLFKRPETDVSKRICFTIGSIGNFVESKDHITLFRACSKLSKEGRSVKIIAIGSGPDLERCKKYSKENKLEVEFRKEVPHEKLQDFYHCIDLFVLPSYFEGFGCVFTEAYASGVPFITCKGQGMDDYKLQEWAAIAPGDYEDLAKKIAYVMDYRPRQVLMGEVDIDSIVVDFVDKIKRMING